MESDNGANCEVLSPVMEDERVSTVASTAPDRTLLLSANHHRVPAPKYRPPPSYNQIRPGTSKTSVNRAELDQSDEDYTDYDSRANDEEDYRDRRSPQERLFSGAQDFHNDEIYFANEYQSRRQLEPNGTIRSTKTINSVHPDNSLDRLNSHSNHKRQCCKFDNVYGGKSIKPYIYVLSVIYILEIS